MAADGPANNQPDAQKAIGDASNLTNGSEAAYNNMMADVRAAQQSFGSDTKGFNNYTQQVADGLRQNGSLEEMAEHFAKSDMYYLAHSDGRNLKPADMNPRFGTNALESAFLGSLQNAYASGDLQARAGTTAWGNPRSQFGEKQFDTVLASRQHERDSADQVRLAQEQAARDQAHVKQVEASLFKNDGDPTHSLFATLDGIKSHDGKLDGKISRGDLRRYQQEYAQRAAAGDPAFTPENLETVRELDRRWNDQLGLALRGTSPASGSPREMAENPQPVPNSDINLAACSQAMGVPQDQIFAANAAPGGQPRVANIDGAGPQPTGEMPQPGAVQYDAAGNPIAAGAAPGGDATVASAASQPGPAPGGDATVASNTPQAGAVQYDAAGNPIAPGAAPGADAGQGAAPIPRAVGPDGRPVPLDQAAAAAPAGAPGAGTGSAYDDYYGAPHGAAGQAAPPADAAGAQPGGQHQGLHRRRRQPGESSGVPATGDQTAGAAAPGGDAAAARPQKAGALPDIDHIPDLQLPVIKPGDDLNKVAQDFQKAAIAHFAAGAVYTVKPGQGWDRIARDTMRKSGEDPSNEGKVEGFSDQIAKMNGLSGRLDKSHVLQPGEQVRVRDDAWIQAQVDAAMKIFQQKVSDAAKAGQTPGAAAPAPTTDLYGGQRNGEGDITPPAGAAAVPAPADAAPHPAAGAQPSAEATPPPGAPPAKGDANAGGVAPPPATAAAGDGPVPIPQGAPPATMPVAGDQGAARTAANVPPPGADTAAAVVPVTPAPDQIAANDTTKKKDQPAASADDPSLAIYGPPPT